MRALLNPDAKKRLGSEHGAADIKSHEFFRGVDWALIADMTPPIVPRFNDPTLEESKRPHRGASVDSMDGGTSTTTTVDAADPFQAFINVTKPETEEADASEERDNEQNDADDD